MDSVMKRSRLVQTADAIFLNAVWSFLSLRNQSHVQRKEQIPENQVLYSIQLWTLACEARH